MVIFFLLLIGLIIVLFATFLLDRLPAVVKLSGMPRAILAALSLFPVWWWLFFTLAGFNMGADAQVMGCFWGVIGNVVAIKISEALSERYRVFLLTWLLAIVSVIVCCVIAFVAFFFDMPDSF